MISILVNKKLKKKEIATGEDTNKKMRSNAERQREYR
jgi:hypothetical protein